MKKAGSACRINAVAVTRLNVVFSGPGDTVLEVAAALLGHGDEDTVTHATSTMKGGWSKEVRDKVEELQEAIEEHLLEVHFEEGAYGGANRSGPRQHRPPKGLVSFELGGSKDPTEQA